MPARPYKRRSFLIEGFQYRLLLINFVYYVITVVTVAGVLFVPLITQLDTDLLDRAEKREVAGLFLFLHARFWPAILAVFLMLAAHSVLTSHRIAGPLYRFRRVFGAIAGGDLFGRAVIRRKDYLAKEADSLNEMIGSLQTKVRGIENQYRKVWAGLTKLRLALDKGSGEAVNQNIEELGAEMDDLKALIDQFQIDGAEPSK